MTDANSWREPLRSLDSTEAQGLTAAWSFSTKILQAFGNFILSSSVRHSVEASSTSRPIFQLPTTLDCNRAVRILTSSSRTPDVGMHSERPRFNLFHKIVIVEVEEGLESKASNIISSSDNEVSSQGAEASGAAAPGRRGRREFRILIEPRVRGSPVAEHLMRQRD